MVFKETTAPSPKLHAVRAAVLPLIPGLKFLGFRERCFL
jgi:hypothetical protein